MSDKLQEIRARHEAATRGPYQWYGYVEGRGIKGSRSAKRRCANVYLSTVARGRTFIMQFEKVGFKDAQPVFQVYRDGKKEFPDGWGAGLMVGAGELAGGPDGFLKEYSGEFVGINNQDAIAIAKSWEDIDVLIAEVDRLKRVNERDRSAIALWVERLRAEIRRSYAMAEGRGSYEWDDDRYRDEFKNAFGRLEKALDKAIKDTHAHDLTDCPARSEEVAAARAEFEVLPA